MAYISDEFLKSLRRNMKRRCEHYLSKIEEVPPHAQNYIPL